MCISDWRLGRMISHDHRTFVVGTAPGNTLTSNRQRVGLVISHTVPLTANQGALVSIDGVAFAMLSYSQPTLFLSLAEHGAVIQGIVTVTQLAGATTGVFIESTLPEDYLAAGWDEFRSKHGLS